MRHLRLKKCSDFVWCCYRTACQYLQFHALCNWFSEKNILKRQHVFCCSGSVPFGFGLAEKLVFKKVSNILGFDRCELWLSGAAPITKETLDYFLSLNLPLCEVYGMSECSGGFNITPFFWKYPSQGLLDWFMYIHSKYDFVWAFLKCKQLPMSCRKSCLGICI